MSKRFMISVAAIALIAGAGAANAQGTGMKGESGGAAMQHSAPAGEAAAPAERGSMQPSGAAAEKSAPSEAAPGAAKGHRAEEAAPGQKSKGMNAQSETKGGGKDMKAEGREGREDNMKAEGRDRDRDQNAAQNREGRDRDQNAAQTTTGQAGAAAKLSTEQRTKITTVIRNEHVAPVNNVGFSISVGTRVPRERISLRPLPSEVVTIYPEWRGYEFFLVRDEIVVVDPRTQEIVAVLPA